MRQGYRILRFADFLLQKCCILLTLSGMSDTIILPRSPRETMAGWVYLPRFIDKIRLHLAGKLSPDYQENFTKGFDGSWLQAAGLTAEQFIAVVKNTVTDGQVCDWVVANVKKNEAEKAAFNSFILNRGTDSDEIKARLKWRKEQAGLAHRDDIQTFVDFIDADEKRI
jgi:hypothetical protein